MVSPRHSSKPASAPFFLTKPDFSRNLQVILDTSWPSLRALPQILLGLTEPFLRSVVTVPAAVTRNGQGGGKATTHGGRVGGVGGRGLKRKWQQEDVDACT